MSRFVHLHVHSYYSMMRGTAPIEDVCRVARARGMDTLALTDTNGLYGLIIFLQVAKELGIHPIIGAELVTGDERAVVLARSRRGYETLCRLISQRHCDEKFSLARALVHDREGIVVLSDSVGLLRQLASPLLRSAGHLWRPTGTGHPPRGRGHGVCRAGGGDASTYVSLSAATSAAEVAPLYAELRPGGTTDEVVCLARELGIPPVATNAVHFLDPEEFVIHRLVRAIDCNTKLSRLPPRELAPRSAWLKPPHEMAKAFVYCPEALKNATRIAAACVVDWEFREFAFPDFAGPGKDRALQTLRARSYEGARRRYGIPEEKELPRELVERLEHELAIIGEKGFASYFLIVEDIVSRFPRTCGRGSAAASIVSYSLGITHVDPIEYHLFFERFLNPGRKDAPDIDVDFPWDERDDVLDYVFRRYGTDRAAMVANHVCLRARAAVREIAKVYGLPEGEIRNVTGRLRQLWGRHRLPGLIQHHPLFKDIDLSPPWPEIINLALAIDGFPRHLSVHCGGMIIVPDAISRHVPMEPAPKGVNIIQWEKDQAEDSGLVKIDLLGNRSLAVIRDVLAAVKANYGIEIDYRTWDPLHDPATQQLIARGDTIGVFYVESPAMRQLQEKTGTGDFEHLVIHSSIIRPAANTYIREYVRRLHGGAYTSLHPILDELLRETYGIMCYQEDVTKVAMAMAGFDAVDGDGLRKALSRKRAQKQLRDYRDQFYGGAGARGVAREVIDRVWEMILSFSGYSFCKPHSASYALVSFKSAYLRAHYPAEFMAAVISNQGGYYATFAYVSEAKRMGLAVLPPDINLSEEPYTGVDREVRIGLMQLKGLSSAGLEAILEERRRGGPYGSFAEFLDRVDIDPSDVKVLIKAGCFDSIAGGRTRPQLMWQLYAVMGERRLGKHLDDPLPEVPDYDEGMLLRHEVEVLGFLVSRHPLTLFEDELRDISYVEGKDLGRYAGRRVSTVGWWVTSKLVTTKTDEPMEFVSFEDTTAIYETTFFPRAYRRFCHMLSRTRPYLLWGKVEEDFGAITFTVDDVAFLDEPLPQRWRTRVRLGRRPALSRLS
ncbi:hypothetical protein AMJ71_07640 [candidate division TA06 bacterium SM1_40]|uniref:DNA-directed DNA polymerase n=3 Tax=Bacteria division TA06 TaxID=1156500 RepID=A0A0S8JK13_UNCT6|nr:MAG: hypothetical protein AMJ71_07640 [candidate division TA06 bacterium SM1_40]